MGKNRITKIEELYGKSMFEVLCELAHLHHNKTSAARALGYSRTHFLRVVCKTYDPHNEVPWADPKFAAAKAQQLRWDKEPLSKLPLAEIHKMVDMRNEDPPVPYYVIGHEMGYHATSVARWVELYEKYGDQAFTRPRGWIEI